MSPDGYPLREDLVYLLQGKRSKMKFINIHNLSPVGFKECFIVMTGEDIGAKVVLAEIDLA